MIWQTYINEDLEDFLIFVFEILRYSKWCHVAMTPQANLSLSNDTDGNGELTKLPKKIQTYKMR